MSGEAVGWAFRKVQMDDATAKFVLVAICNYANDEDKAWPSHASISRLTGLSKRTIQNAVQKLEDWGIIKRIRRDRENGSETSAMVSINLDVSWVVKGGIASAAIGVMQELPQGIAADSTLETKDKPQGKAPSRAKKDINAKIIYTDDFEQIWKAYPRRDGSKPKAFDYWNMLNDENRARVVAAIPVFAERMRREGRPNDKIPHLTTWFNGREWETAAAPAGAPVAGAGPAKPFWETATPKAWSSALLLWSQNWNWNKIWGPEPGKDGCHVPQYILDRFDLRYRGHLYSVADFEALKARVEAASKHAVDKERAA